MTQSRHAEQSSYIISVTSEKKQKLLKKALSHLAGLAHLLVFISKIFISPRDCSYGDELARLGGLAHLGEILSSLGNSCKNIMCSYEK